MDEELLSVYPVRSMEFEEKDDIVTILFINPKPNFFERKLFKKQVNKPKKIDLDQVGSFIWKQCNGDNKISDIIEIVKDKFGDELDNAGERVILFMKQLNKSHFINLFKKEKV